MAERGLSVDHSTVARWVLWYALELSKPIRRHLRRPVAPGVSTRRTSELPDSGLICIELLTLKGTR